MIQNTLRMECKARGQDKVFAHTNYKPGSFILSYYKINTLQMEYKAWDQDKVPTSHYYELVMEVVRVNPWISLPLEILKERFLFGKYV